MRLAGYLTAEEVRSLETANRSYGFMAAIPVDAPPHIRALILEVRAKRAGIDLADRAEQAELQARLDATKTTILATA